MSRCHTRRSHHDTAPFLFCCTLHAPLRLCLQAHRVSPHRYAGPTASTLASRPSLTCACRCCTALCLCPARPSQGCPRLHPASPAAPPMLAPSCTLLCFLTAPPAPSHRAHGPSPTAPLGGGNVGSRGNSSVGPWLHSPRARLRGALLLCLLGSEPSPCSPFLILLSDPVLSSSSFCLCHPATRHCHLAERGGPPQVPTAFCTRGCTSFVPQDHL